MQHCSDLSDELPFHIHSIPDNKTRNFLSVAPRKNSSLGRINRESIARDNSLDFIRYNPFSAGRIAVDHKRSETAVHGGEGDIVRVARVSATAVDCKSL